ncbi:MAG: 3-oxoacyl-ACP reductase, partial [Acidimicrobiia bacterium]
ETLHHELTERQAKIRVSVICPGLVHTNLGAADRNRPPSLVNDPDAVTGPSAQITAELLREYGMPVEQLAERVFDAIKQDKFYILPHTEAKPAIELRLDDVRREGLPTDSNTLSSRIPR